MPPSKISKALDRVARLVTSDTATRTDFLRLLGSLRHVCSCLRAAKPFYQRVHSAAKHAPRLGRVPLTRAVQHDLRWFRAILLHSHRSGLPLAMFCELPPVSIHLHMDASDEGLAVLDSDHRRYAQLQFDDEERPSFTGRRTASTSMSVSSSVRRWPQYMGQCVDSVKFKRHHTRSCLVRQRKCSLVDQQSRSRQCVWSGTHSRNWV
ncbi:hypothetical protein JG687_00017418 [Phytophthora cactorum]|uniref:Uncharacterized protein n=1 Tax=Phytophthora cactorum TaxID=29920 RepID=A0A8T1TTA7_9STRA|nr:hypothetical protein JG687_00017418 [Phytophthora cactorum]